MSSNKGVEYWAVIPAAGSGSRMRSRRPKQYLPLSGRRLLEWSLAPFLSSRWIAGVVVVLAADDRRFPKLEAARHPKLHRASGAAARAGSVLAGLDIVAQHCTVPRRTFVLVHDAARPCLHWSDVEKLRDTASDRNGGLLAVPAVDTLKQSTAGRARLTLDRSQVWQAQTPQMFRLDLLRAALKTSLDRDIEITDEASAMEHAGYRPKLVEATPGNLKITYPQDLRLAEFWLAQRQSGT